MSESPHASRALTVRIAANTHGAKSGFPNGRFFDLEFPIALTLIAPQGSHLFHHIQDCRQTLGPPIEIGADQAVNEKVVLPFRSDREMIILLDALANKAFVGDTMHSLKLTAQQLCQLRDAIIAPDKTRQPALP